MYTEATGILSRSLTELAIVSAGLLVALLVWQRAIRIRVRPRPLRARAGWLGGLLRFLSLSVVMATPAAAAGPKRSVPPHRAVPAAALPWSTTDGPPPPRPSVGSRVTAPPFEIRSTHPAIHGDVLEARGASQKLFPRAGKAASGRQSASGSSANPARRSQRREVASDAPEPADSASRAACMAAHPSGRTRFYVVRPGDSLWTIAERRLCTDDPVAVARYWARIHRLNRDVIGPNPDLIYPGQTLELPRSE